MAHPATQAKHLQSICNRMQRDSERCSECVALVALRDNLTWDDIVDLTYIYIYILY